MIGFLRNMFGKNHAVIMNIIARKNRLVLGTLRKAFYDLPVRINLNV